MLPLLGVWFKSVELCLWWGGNLSANMPPILRHPADAQDKEENNYGSFFSFTVNDCVKNKQGEPTNNTREK